MKFNTNPHEEMGVWVAKVIVDNQNETRNFAFFRHSNNQKYACPYVAQFFSHADYANFADFNALKDSL